MASVDVLTFLGGVQDVRELLASLARYCNPAELLVLDSSIVGSGTLGASWQIQPDAVTNDMFLIANLCGPKDISQASYMHLDPVTETGALAVQRIGAAILNTPTTDPQQLTALLALSSVSAVLAVRQLCLVALQASLSPANCFRLYSFAAQCGISPLRQRAEECCLANLPAPDASSQDVQGFNQLHLDLLQHLLQSDALQVTSEVAVFKAILAWVRAQPQGRAPLLGELVRSCVRLGSMDLHQLEELDQDPDVLGSQEMTRIVAQAYIMRITGPAGCARGCTARPSVARVATAACGAQLTATWASVSSPARTAVISPRPIEEQMGGEIMVWAQ